MKEKKSGKPFSSLWFGNFFEPAFSDKEYIVNSMNELEKMGFNSVILDSKSWQDFFDRYDGKEASQYVAMQEFMIEQIKLRNLSHWFLAIYLSGDNLYPTIRYSPPVIGEGVTSISGEKMQYYRYWSDKAQDSMISHTKGLFSLYSENHTEIEIDGEPRLPICSMWDPITEPSFDEDGIKRYHDFLLKRYDDISTLNKRYATCFKSISELTPADYWSLKYPTERDNLNESPAFWKYADNQLYRAYELVEHFKAMKTRFSLLDSKLYLMPNLCQWSIFLNINRKIQGDLWDTANRGIDPYQISRFVDNATFMTVPMLPDATPNPYVTEYQNSMMRMMNVDRAFSVGFYLGRHTAFDIYREITPAEIIGSAVASGADSYHAYGYCGLDDGGMMHRLGKLFKQSIADGNKWAERVIPQISRKTTKQAAILYPSQMAVMEGYTVNRNEQRRLDSLGLFQACCDNAIMIDVIHIDQIEEGILSDYDLLILPQNSCYHIDPSELAEKNIKSFVENGGTLFHTANEPISKKVFNIQAAPHSRECIRFNDGFIPSGELFYSFDCGDTIAYFEDSKKPAVVVNYVGNGRVYSFGYMAGEEYIAHINHPVPPQYGNDVFYPLNLTNDEPLSQLLRKAITPVTTPERGITFSQFENGMVIVNHTSYPYDTSNVKGDKDFVHPSYDGEALSPHSAVWVKF